MLRPADAAGNVGFEDLQRSVYVVLAYNDLDKMAGNFGFKEGELKTDAVTRMKAYKGVPLGQNEVERLHVLARGGYVYLSMSEPLLRRVRAVPLLSGTLSPAQKQAFSAADVLVLVKPEVLGGETNELVNLANAEIGKLADPHEKETVKQFVQALAAVRHALIGFRVDNGLGISLLTDFGKDAKEARPFLESLRGSGIADLTSLPEGRAIFAQAFAGDGSKSAVIARILTNFALKNLLESRQITSATDRAAFVSVFGEVWQRLQGSRVAIYLTRDESKLGLFSLVAILDTNDAADLVAELRTLARMAEGKLDLTKKAGEGGVDIVQLIKDLSSEKYQVRASATTRLRLLGEPALAYLERTAANPPDLETSRRAELLIREISAVAAERRKELLTKDLPRFVRPSFSFVAKAETRAGHRVDVVHVKLADKDQVYSKQLQQLFGPDWDKIRLAVHKKQVVALLGSEVELFDQALANLKDGKPGLAASKLAQKAASAQASRPSAAFYVSVESLLGLLNARSRRLEPERLSSLILSADDDTLGLDMFLPIPDIKAINKVRQP